MQLASLQNANQLNQDVKVVAKMDTKQRLFVAQKQQMENIQQVNLLRVQDQGEQKNKQEQQPTAKTSKFEYKDVNQAGSADDLIRAVAQQESQVKKTKQQSTFAPRDDRNKEHAIPDQTNLTNNGAKRLKAKIDKGESKRQSSYQ